MDRQHEGERTDVTEPTWDTIMDYLATGGVVPDLPGSITRYTPLADLNDLPTIFPAPVASMITTIATSTRLSLRMSAFLIEAILETTQYSTRMSLGYTRRLLITAISSARRVYLMSHAALDGDLLSITSGSGGDAKHPSTSTDAFLSVLDKYTNLGIYVIHHTFTMAELFAMSGLFLTASAVSSFHQAAHDSVALFDSLFGSNESSRALSAIITMVRKEVIQDERCKGKSAMSSLAGLTKAMTAFACLQAATWQRTSHRLKMRVLYDCTVLAEHTNLLVDSSPKADTAAQPLSKPGITSAAPRPLAGPGPSTMENRQRQASSQYRSAPRLDEANRRLHAHDQSPFKKSSCSRTTSPETFETWSADDLGDLVGESGDEMYEGPPNDAAREQHRQKRRRESRPEITDELTESTVITQLLERIHPNQQPYKPTPSHWRQLSLPDVSVEDLDDDEPDVVVRTAATSVVTSPKPVSHFSSSHDENESEWIEVDQLLDEDNAEIPTSPNGGQSTSLTASVSQAALEHSHSAERIQLVLKTMTNKLLQRKRTVRHILNEMLSEASDSDSTAVPTRRSVLGPQSGKATGSTSPLASFDSRSSNPRRRSSDKSLARGRGLFNITRKVTSDISTPTPSREHSPTSDLRSSRPALISVTTRKDTGSSRGIRAPPPSPHTAFTARSPIVSPLTRQHPDSTRRSAIQDISQGQRQPEETSSKPRQRRPSLATVREAVHTSSSRIQSATSQLLPDVDDASPDNLFPHEGLIRNIHRFMRYSSAAYGQNFLRILGLGTSDFIFPSTGKHHANSWAFAQHTGLPIDCLLLSSFAEATATLIQQEAPPLVHYVAVAHDLKAVVLTCRGTLGVSDVLVDLTCEYQTIQVDRGVPDASYYVHAGMWQSARKLTVKQSTVHQTLVDALSRYTDYGLVLAGHSLGGGVAALLAILSSMPADSFMEQNHAKRQPGQHPLISTPFVTNFSSGLPPGRPIHCYAYGPPAVTSPDLATYSRGLITSVVQDSDVVPTLSLGGVKDFKNIALTLSEEGNVAEEIVGRVIGVYRRKFGFQGQRGDSRGPSGMQSSLPTEEEALSDWMVSLIKTMRADMDNEKLYPPGMVYIMEHFDVFVTDEALVPATARGKEKKVVHKQAHRVILRQCDSVEERFGEPVFAKSMLQNHLPSQYERSTQLLFDGLGQGRL
ncbi:hypothetical protein IAU60_004516 [Kwoniella sp. DSM 27419]